MTIDLAAQNISACRPSAGRDVDQRPTTKTVASTGTPRRQRQPTVATSRGCCSTPAVATKRGEHKETTCAGVGWTDINSQASEDCINKRTLSASLKMVPVAEPCFWPSDNNAKARHWLQCSINTDVNIDE